MPDTGTFAFARRAEQRYGRQLRKIAQHIADLAQAYDLNDPVGADEFARAMEQYAALLTPWARNAAAAMVEDIDRRDGQAWRTYTARMSAALRDEIANAPTGAVMQALMADQVGLIRSLPIEAAERVHKLVIEARFGGKRAAEVAQEIARTGEVTKSRATLIARTEISRAATTLTQARAMHVGSEAYVWRTTGDADVRPSHRKMSGKVVYWNSPPTLDNMTGHAGCFPRCRCHVEPIIPE